MNITTLYSRDMNGVILQWSIHIEQDATDVNIVKTFGVYGGKMINYVTPITVGKNIGRSNETTALTQATKEMKSAITHKLKEGYMAIDEDTVLNIEQAIPHIRLDDNGRVKPMKAQPFDKKNIPNRFSYQPKINGVRAFITISNTPDVKDLFNQSDISVDITSKEGLVYNVPGLIEELRRIGRQIIDTGINSLVIDGELYIKDEHVTAIGGAARNAKNPLNMRLSFIIFDIAISDIIQVDRDKIRALSLGVPITNPHDDYKDATVYNLITYYAAGDMITNSYLGLPNDVDSSWTDAIELFMNHTNMFLEQGYEGSIMRDLEAEYRFGSRPKTMMKLKKFFDEEYKLIDIIPSARAVNQKTGNKVAMFVCTTNNGKVFNVTPYGYTMEEREEMLEFKDVYLLKGRDTLVTVKYYEKVNGMPFHANGHIRNYE